jgi:hypothetical protein
VERKSKILRRGDGDILFEERVPGSEWGGKKYMEARQGKSEMTLTPFTQYEHKT